MTLHCFILLIIPVGVFVQTISEEPTNIVALEGESVTFTCTISGIESDTNLAWRKDSETIVSFNDHISEDIEGSESNRVSISRLGSQGTYNLQFSYVVANDLGTYECGFVRPNDTYIWSQAAQLAVIQFSEHPNNATIYEYDELTLSCVIDNKLPGQATVWLKDPNEVLAIDDRVLLGSDDNRTSAYVIDGQYELHFSYTRLNDSGTYRCGVLADTGRYYPSNGAEVVVMEMPDFVAQPLDTQVLENEPAILTCAIDIQIENFTIAWQKDSDVLNVLTLDNIHLSGNPENGEYNLEFVHTTADDSGLYRCGIDTGNDGVYYWSKTAVLSVENTKLTTSTEYSTARYISTTSVHDTSTTEESLTTKVTASPLTHLNTESSTTRSVDSTEQSITTMDAIDSTSQFTLSTNSTPIPAGDKLKTTARDDNLFLVVLLSIVFGVLFLLGIAAIIAMIVVSVRRNRRKKHHEEYSPQERVIDEWKLRSLDSTSNPDLESAIDMKTGISNIIAMDEEDDFDSANWSNSTDAGSEGSDQIKTEHPHNFEELYAKPDKSFKSKNIQATHNLEKTNLTQKPEIDSQTDESTAVNARSLLRNYKHIYENIDEEKVNNKPNTSRPRKDSPTNATSNQNSVANTLPLRESVMINANTATILLDDFQMEEEPSSHAYAESYCSDNSQTRL